MATESFRVDTSEFGDLAAELQRNLTSLLMDARRETAAAGKEIQRKARAAAKSKTMPGLSRSIWSNTKNTASGVEVVVEAKSPLGYIREYGAGRSGPHPFMGPALDSTLPGWESALQAALSKVL